MFELMTDAVAFLKGWFLLTELRRWWNGAVARVRGGEGG